MFSIYDPKVALIAIVVIALFMFYQQRMLQSQLSSLRDYLLGQTQKECFQRPLPPRDPPLRGSPMNDRGRLSNAESVPQSSSSSSSTSGPRSVFSQDTEDEFDDDSTIEEKYNGK